MTPVPLNPAAPAAAAPASPARKAAERSAHDFEAVFSGAMAKMMLESVEVDTQFGGGHGEEMFRGVLAEHLGPAIAGQGGLGIAPAVLQQILRLQGESGQ
jgi:peptidoglycan hydrolase FlgJ